MAISRRGLLQWNPSSEVEGGGDNELPTLIGMMWIGPVLAVTTAAALWLQRPTALPAALPIALLWFASPVISWRISRARKTAQARLEPGQEVYLPSSGGFVPDPFIGFELIYDLLGALRSWRKARLAFLPNHFITRYEEKVRAL